MGKYEVTQGQWQALMKTSIHDMEKKKSYGLGHLVGVGSRHPMYFVNWNDANDFCKKLNDDGYAPSGYKFTLPTEAQWEFACRAGTESAYSYDTNEVALADFAWFGKASGSGTHEVGLLRSNGLGFYDMHGNVWEWCLDNYTHVLSNVKAEVTRNYRDSAGSPRVGRGGSWSNCAARCRSAYRSGWNPDVRRNYLGFRVALVQAD